MNEAMNESMCYLITEWM